MRVSNRTIYQNITDRLSTIADQLQVLNEQISSGKKINRLSDDPIGLTHAQRLKKALSQMNQYKRNMDTGKAWLNMSEQAFTQVLDLAGRAQGITIQMANETQSAETRMQVAVEIGHLLDQAIALGNTKVGDSYIFAGYLTQTAPFTRITSGGIETAQYLGDTNDFQIKVGKGESLTVGRNGQTAFMNSSFFDTLGTLKAALETNDVATIQQQIGNLRQAENEIQKQIADLGARANRLDGKEEIFNQFTLQVEDQLSQIEDADLTRVVIDLKEKELAYQAALMSAARIMELSLMNYL